MTNRYENYKHSGIEWLDEIPEHWKIDRIKNKLYNSGGGKYGEVENFLNFNLPCISISDFKNGDIYCNESIIMKRSYNIKNILKKGTILIEKSGGGDKVPVGRVILIKKDIESYYTNFVIGINTKENYKFISYLLKSIHKNKIHMPYVKQNTGLQNFDYNSFSYEQKIALPSKKEQEAIANYLDKKTQEIDDSVETLKKQKDILIEERKAIIHKAVTKGLDDTVPMKDSGVEWIRDIPEHWDVKRLKNVLTKQIRTGRLDVNAEEENGKYPFFTCSIKSKKINSFSFDAEALLIAGNGDVGHVRYYKGKFDAYQRTYVITGFNSYSPIFLKYFIQNFLKKKLEINKKGSVIDFIKLSHLTEFYIPFFNLKEQEKIVKYLDKKTSRIDEALKEIEKQIDLLEEYKKVLINDVVTGKKRVYDGEI